MKRKKITCLSVALIVSTLLTGCSLGDIPVVGKYLSKDSGAQADVSTDDQGDVTDVPSQNTAVTWLNPVPVGTVLSVNDILDQLELAGFYSDGVDKAIIADLSGTTMEEMVINEETYFTFAYHSVDMENEGDQEHMDMAITVTDEVASDIPMENDELQEDVSGQSEGESQDEPQAAVARYEVFDYSDATNETFGFSSLENGTLYVNSVMDFDIHSIPFIDEYESISKNLEELTKNYTDADTTIASKLTAYCIPKAYVYMQALDYEEGADMSAYAGEYVIVLEPVYDGYTDEIYRSEDTLLLPLIDDVNEFAKNPSDAAKNECDFLLNENFDDEGTDIEDFYGAMEIIMQLTDTEDIFIFDDVLKVAVVDYCDMGTPDNMSDDVTWEDYESGALSTSQEPTAAEEPSGEEAVGTSSGESGATTQTTTTQTTTTTQSTTTTTSESVIGTINKDVANSFRSRHPELFTFFPESEQIYSKWDWRIDDNTTVKGTIVMEDGTILPQLSITDGAFTYNMSDGTSTKNTSSSTSGISTGSSSSVFGASSSDDDYYSGSTSSSSTTSSSGSMTMGNEGYETSEPEEKEDDDSINEYELSFGDTSCKVVANNTYRYMLDNQNSSSSQAYINNRDKRYTIKIVGESDYMQYWTKDYLNRSMNSYSIVTGNYSGVTDADNNAITLMNIQYNNGTEDVTEPYMAYIRNGSEYIIIIPDEAESAGSETLADILKRCIEMQ